MKNILKYSTLGFVVVVVAFSSCLKTNKFYEGFGDIAPIADIPLSNLSNSSDSTTLYTLDISSNPTQTIDTAIAVHLSDKSHVGDVTFKLAVVESDPTFLAMYNNNQAIYDTYDNEDLTGRPDSAAIEAYVGAHPHWTIMPDSLYTITNLDVTIPNAGVLNIGRMGIKFRTGAVDQNGTNLFATHSYILPIAIQDAGGYEIASNFREIFLVVGVKNQYDGVYNYAGAEGWFGAVRKVSNVKLITAGLNDVSGNLFFYYSNGITYHIDPTTHVASVLSVDGGYPVTQYPAVSKYDLATKSMHIEYDILGAHIVEDFTYVKPR